MIPPGITAMKSCVYQETFGGYEYICYRYNGLATIMKKILLIVLIILFQSCKSESKKQLETEVIEKRTEIIVEEIESKTKEHVPQIDSIMEPTELDIDYIKSKTSPLSKTINVENIIVSELEKIPLEFIAKYITPHKIDIGYPEYLPADYPESYAFNEFKEFDNFYLFTFIHDDENCCRTLYAVTIEKEKLKVISIGVIGFTGADGGWIGKKIGKWTRETIIETMTTSSYDEDFIEKNNNTEIDTTWSIIKTGQNGYLENTESLVVKYVGDKQVE